MSARSRSAAQAIKKGIDNQKDLGVFVDQSAKPSLQVSKAAQKANQVLGRLLRSFKCREKTTMVQLYNTFVRPAWSMPFKLGALIPLRILTLLKKFKNVSCAKLPAYLVLTRKNY